MTAEPTRTADGFYLDHVAAFVESFDLAEAPAAVAAHAAAILLDTVGVMVSGSATPEVRALQSRLGRVVTDRAGTASSPGSSLAFAPATAAFLNGTAGTWDELDEGNYVTHQHPAIHVVPAALAVAEARDLSGWALLEAVVVGYEVAARAGAATTFRDDVMHPHGTHGILGGAAAVAKLLRLTAPQVRSAIGIASSMSVATVRGTVFEGATVRNTYAGQAGQHAVLAADLALAGFTAQCDGPGALLGTVSGTAFDRDRFTAGLGTDFLLTRNYFKFHACCAYNHATLDALRKATGARTFTAADIARVDIATYFPATRMTATRLRSPLAAKFSLPFTAAAMLTRGGCDRDVFQDRHLRAEDIRDLMDRVHVVEDPKATRDYPQAQRARVRVLLADGSTLAASVDRVVGDWRAPASEAALTEKFDRMSQHLSGTAVTRLRQGLSRPGGVPAGTLGDLIRGETA